MEARALLLAVAGTVLLFTFPLHRIDLLAYAVIAPIAAVAWQPRVGAFLVGASIPLYFATRTLVGGVSVSMLGVFLSVTCAGVLLRAALRLLGRRRESAAFAWPRTGYDAPLALFLVAALVSLLVTEYPLLSVRELRAVVFEPVVFFLLLAIMRPSGGAQAALAGFLLTAAITAASAIIQVVFGLGGTEAEGVRRAQAWYPSPNHLALTLGRALPFYVAALAVPRGHIPSRLVPWLMVGTALVGSGLVLTFSTGGWLGGAAAIVVVLAAVGRRRSAVRLAAASAAVLVGISVLAVVGALPERLNPLRQTGGFRVDLWLSALHMARDHPLLGVGPDNFVYQYQQVYIREGGMAEPNLSHAHNWVLNFWLELGLLGLAAFVWVLARFYRRVRDALACERGWIIAGAAGAMADVLVHGMIDNSYFLVDLAFLFWLLLSLPAGRIRAQ